MRAPCPLCNGFERRARDYRIAWTCDMGELTASAGQGCRICGLLLEGVSYFENSVGGRNNITSVSVSGPTIESPYWSPTCIQVDVWLKNQPPLRLEFFHDKDSAGATIPTISRAMRTLPRIPSHTSCQESFQWSSRVIQNCLETHRACNPPSMSEYPSRLLEIGPSANSQDEFLIRLVDVNELPKPMSSGYICLSHRWGEVQSLKTETNTLRSHALGIPWQSLPRTYQDAIHFTQRLGLHYLWIDSLCIVQDDEREWRHESVRMAAIYRNDFLTIAASKANDDRGGCYSGDMSRDRDFLVKLACWADSTSRVYVREMHSHFDSSGSKDSSVSREFPLLDRGWVYQERLLSPRVLYFGTRELLWECREFRTCQCQEYWPAEGLKQKYSAFISREKREAERAEQARLRAEKEKLAENAPVMVGLQNLPSGSAEASPRVPSVEVHGKREHWKSIAPHLVQKLRAKAQDWSQAYSADTNRLSVGGTRQFTRLKATAPMPPNTSEATQVVIAAARFDGSAEFWHELVSDYSGLELSRTSDRLPAIAGLAREIQEVRFRGTPLVYLAGLWQDSLINDLLWRVTEPLQGRGGDRPRDHNPPSWSWASVSTRVAYWPGHFADPHFQITSAETSVAAYTDDFGESTGGRITVTGPFRMEPATLCYNPTISASTTKAPTSQQFSIYVSGSSIPIFADYCLAKPGIGYVEDRGQVFCLGDFVSEKLRASLVVRKLILGEHKIVYQRIGIVLLKREATTTKGTPVRVTINGVEPGMPKTSWTTSDVPITLI